jgi:hypothetical protein
LTEKIDNFATTLRELAYIRPLYCLCKTKPGTAYGRGDTMKHMRLLGIVLAFGMIAYGVVREEHFVAFRKAVNICMECIGLG